MKKALSLFLAFVLTLGIFCGMPSAKIQANAVEVSDIFTVKTCGFENGTIVYTLYLNAGISISGAVVCAKFDPSVLSVDTEKSGAHMVTDVYGDESPRVSGIYVSGIMDEYEDRFSVGYVNSDLYKDYNSGSSDKPFMSFAFNSVAEECPETFVEFYCVEFTNMTSPDNNIVHGSDILISSLSSVSEHSYSDWIIKKQATCTKKGLKQIECTVCQKIFKEEEIPAKGHKAGNWVVYKKATVYAAGSKRQKCTVCGAILKTAKISQLKCAKPKIKTIANTTTGVKITWGKITGADSYQIYRRVKGGSYSKIATTSKTYFTDKKAKSGKQYYYIVKAVNEAGTTPSSSLTIRFLTDPTLKTPTSSKKGITLKWSKVTGATGYIVYRKTGNGSYKKLATVKGVTKVSYLDKYAKKNYKYTYKVKAYYGKTYSAYSNTKTIKDKY